MKRVMEGSHAVSQAVQLARVEVISAYPITPQTHIVERLADLVADGVLDAKFIRVESEHSALATVTGSATAGVRSFTASSSQGLALMHEMLHWASGARLPLVMAEVNRALAPGWNIWADQTDSLSQRDTGWIQIYCEDAQESLDSVIQAFRIAERVLLPCMVVLEANYISHFMEPVEVPEPEQVDRFLPPVNIPKRFDVENPGFVGPVVTQSQYEGFRRLSHEAMAHALEVIEEVDREFAGHFGRGYGLVEAVGLEEAELVLVTTASITSTARAALTRLREKGHRVGLLKIRLFRPFPTKILRQFLDPVPRIAVLERNLSLGREGIFCSELKAALVNSRTPHQVQGYLAGIGGTDVNPELIERVVLDALGRREALDTPIWMTEEAL
jgi:pyruvate/2-oxoacid:ferredoxin oxidoreductase alpha subunit